MAREESDDERRARFHAAVADAFAAGDFTKLVLSKPKRRGGELVRVTVRPLALARGRVAQVRYEHRTRVTVRNLPFDAAAQELAALLDAEFTRAHLLAGGRDLQLVVSKRGKVALHSAREEGAEAEREGEPGEDREPDAGEAHDRAKRRYVDLAAPFLTALGITDASHRLIPERARKWKQINKFVEVLEDALEGAGIAPGEGPEPLRIVDFGAGKGYLTFAAHVYLGSARGFAVETVGVEQRADLVAQCNDAAASSGIGGLRFVEGELGSLAPERLAELADADVLIALHACDTATDEALCLGVRAGAAVIVAAPCCHKEIRPQMERPPALEPLLRHGVHLGAEAEMVTDSIRALLLEAAGYRAKVFEFVSLEHTSKNKMILATRRGGDPEPGRRAEALERLAALKAFYGITEQRLERLLARG